MENEFSVKTEQTVSQPTQAATAPPDTPYAEVAVVDEKGKKKSKLNLKESINKEKIIKTGKDSAITFALKKIFTSLLSAILSAALVLFTQYSFKDNMKDYYNDFLMVHYPVFQELYEFVEIATDLNYDELIKYYNDNDVLEKSCNLLQAASSYSSDNKDVQIIHNQFISLCEEMLTVSNLLKSIGQAQDGNLSQFLTCIYNIVSKLQVFMDTTDRICEKHNLDKIYNFQGYGF